MMDYNGEGAKKGREKDRDRQTDRQTDDSNYNLEAF